MVFGLPGCTLTRITGLTDFLPRATAGLLAVAVVLVVPLVASGAGAAHSENFIVLAPSEALADELLARAEQFRQEVAMEWLGKPLPPNIGPTILHLELSDSEDRGQTWVIDHPDRKYHRVWLVTNRESAMGSTLRHEIVHVVMATRFPKRLPQWAEEGAASLSDGGGRPEIRENIIDWYAETKNWPDLAGVFESEIIPSHDKAAYSVAASVTHYLLSKKDKPTFIAFAAESKEDGLDAALHDRYGIGSLTDLQGQWEAWVTRAAKYRSHVNRSTQ